MGDCMYPSARARLLRSECAPPAAGRPVTSREVSTVSDGCGRHGSDCRTSNRPKWVVRDYSDGGAKYSFECSRCRHVWTCSFSRRYIQEGPGFLFAGADAPDEDDVDPE